jgi:hypothetical protein
MAEAPDEIDVAFPRRSGLDIYRDIRLLVVVGAAPAPTMELRPLWWQAASAGRRRGLRWYPPVSAARLLDGRGVGPRRSALRMNWSSPSGWWLVHRANSFRPWPRTRHQQTEQAPLDVVCCSTVPPIR